MDVLHSAGGEVVVQHEVDSFEVDSSGEQSRADQYPNLTRAKAVDYVVPLKQTSPGGEGWIQGFTSERTHNNSVLSVCVDLLLCALCVDHVYIDAFIHQLMEKLPRSLYRLYKHQHGRQETLKMT